MEGFVILWHNEGKVMVSLKNRSWNILELASGSVTSGTNSVSLNNMQAFFFYSSLKGFFSILSLKEKVKAESWQDNREISYVGVRICVCVCVRVHLSVRAPSHTSKSVYTVSHVSLPRRWIKQTPEKVDAPFSIEKAACSKMISALREEEKK